MTEEIEKAVKYIFDNYCRTNCDYLTQGECLEGVRTKCNEYEIREQAYLAGLHEGQPKWHDLRKDPNDLPPQGVDVFIADEYSKYFKDRVPTTAWREGNCWMSMDERNKRPIGWKIYAWHELPKIPEELMKEE